MDRRLAPAWPRLRRTLVFTVVLFSFAVTILVALVMTMSLVYGDPVRIYFDQFGERGLELGLMAAVVGAMPFVLLVLDEALAEA